MDSTLTEKRERPGTAPLIVLASTAALCLVVIATRFFPLVLESPAVSAILLPCAAVVFLLTGMPPGAKRLFSPCGFLFWSYLFYMFFGIVNYYAFERFLYTYFEIGFARGGVYLSAGLLALVLGIWSGSALDRPRGGPGSYRALDPDRLFYTAAALSCAVIAVNLYIFLLSGGIPVVVGYLKEDMFTEGGIGKLAKAVQMGSVCQIVLYYYIVNAGAGARRTAAMALVALLAAIAYGYGTRFLFVMPLLFLLFFLTRRLRASVNYLVTSLFVAAILVFSAVAINIRAGENVVLGEVVQVVASQIGVRGRDFYVLVDYFDHLEGFLGGFTLLPLVTNIFPAPLWALVGIDKAAYTKSAGMYLSYHFDKPFYVNTGIMGEFFLNGGMAMLVFGLFLYGLLVHRIDMRWRRSPEGSLSSLLFGYLLANLCINLTAGHFFGLSHWIYQYGLILLVIGLAVSRVRKDGEGTLLIEGNFSPAGADR